LQDTGSANGTFVNGSRIYTPHTLQNDDLIGLGSPAPLLRFFDPDPTVVSAQRLHYDERKMVFYLSNQEIVLTQSQLRLMLHLYQHAGEVCSRESCAQAIWGRDYDPGMDAGALDEAIGKLRKQIYQVDPDAKLITTRRGAGYTLEP
jgi:DNA-binding response OmpR family regulator